MKRTSGPALRPVILRGSCGCPRSAAGAGVAAALGFGQISRRGWCHRRRRQVPGGRGRGDPVHPVPHRVRQGHLFGVATPTCSAGHGGKIAAVAAMGGLRSPPPARSPAYRTMLGSPRWWSPAFTARGSPRAHRG
ncbi:hypothetical protein HBB16_10120 [Pseudonocardia sp. MCCB 268]|nr:hypothetical protein [Pseudonocardia cytotoxica]